MCIGGLYFIRMIMLSIQKSLKYGFVLLCIAVAGITAGNPASAQNIFVVQHLDFGEFALKDNDASHTIIVDPNNNVTADPEIVFNSTPMRGEYLLTGQDTNRALDITVTNGSLTLNGSGVGASMTVNNFTDNSPSTDGAGDATIYIGGTLTTNGTSTIYSAGSYEDNTVEMTIDYQ